MTSTPRRRSSPTTSFMRGAISATRAVAPLHQCWSHISQITTAVFSELQLTVDSTERHELVVLSVGTRRRSVSLESALAAATLSQRLTHSPAASAMYRPGCFMELAGTSCYA